MHIVDNLNTLNNLKGTTRSHNWLSFRSLIVNQQLTTTYFRIDYQSTVGSTNKQTQKTKGSKTFRKQK